MLIRKLKSQLIGKGLKAELLRGSLGSLFLKVINTLLGLLMGVVLARTLGPEGYGVYAYVLAIVTLLALPSQVGLPIIVVRETARAQVQEQWGLMRGLWFWSSNVVTCLSFLITLSSLGVVWFVADRFNTLQLHTFYFGLLLVPVVAMGNLRGAALRGLQHVVIGQLPESMLRPGLLVLLLMGTYWSLGHPIDAAVAMGLNVLASGIVFAIGLLLLWYHSPPGVRSRPPLVYESRAWIKAIIPLALTSGIGMITTQSDIIMLGWFRSEEEVGIYRVVASTSGLVSFGSSAIITAFAPHFARLDIQNDLVRLQRLATTVARASFLMALPVVLPFWLYGDVLLSWMFGEGFSRGSIPLSIIVVGALVSAVMGATGSLLNMTGHERETARISTVSALCNLTFNLLLIPWFGMSGAALATTLSLSIWSVCINRAIRLRVGIKSSAIVLR